MVTSYLTILQYQNQQTGFGTMLVYSFMPFYYICNSQFLSSFFFFFSRGPHRPRDQGPRGPGRRAAPAPPQAARAWATARRREASPTPPPPPPPARGSLTFRVAPDHHARAQPPPPASLAPPPPHGALAWGGEKGREKNRTAAPRSTLAPRSQRPTWARPMAALSRPLRRARAPRLRPAPPHAAAGALPGSSPPFPTRGGSGPGSHSAPRCASARLAPSLGRPWTTCAAPLPGPPAEVSPSAARDRLARGGGEERGACPPSASRDLRASRWGWCAVLLSASPRPALHSPVREDTSSGTDHA